ncbi:MAG: hypothetical protein E3J44_00955 [Candidatus Aminicenantes bacterium]|nr:MAG: hypothetical protein E3J44_00955 [Candidatus Aminicenantes bacterium]
MKKLFMIIPLILLICFTLNCQNQEAMAELEEIKAQAEVEAQNEELIRNYFKELDKGNAEILKEVYTPDAAYYFPSGISESMSVEHEIEMVKMFHNAIPDLIHNIEELFSVGDRIIVRFVARGTYTGELEEMGLPATGNKVEVSSIIIFRIENGKVVEERQEADMLGFMQQLGMELKPKEAEK